MHAIFFFIKLNNIAIKYHFYLFGLFLFIIPIKSCSYWKQTEIGLATSFFPE